MDGAGRTTAADNGGDLITAELKTLLDTIEASYWVPGVKTPVSGLQELGNALQTSGSLLYAPVASFTTNICAALQLLEFPYMALAPHVLRGTPIHDEARKPRGDDAAQQALAVRFFTHALNATDFHTKPEAMRLMHQALLLTWSALEIYCKEIFIYSLNARPSLFSNIQRVQTLKQRFSISQDRWLPLLEQHGYNFNGCLGDILAGDRDFSSPQFLRELFGALYKGEPAENETGAELLESFQEDAFWKLGQRRHLIAHKCGVVDEEYIRKTDDPGQTVGQLLKLRGRDVGEAMSVATRCAMALIIRAS